MGLLKWVNSLVKPLDKNALLDTYADVFRGLGRYEREYKIELREDVEPVVQPPRRVPYPKKEKLCNTLDSLQTQSVVAKVDTATDWVSYLVVVEKKKEDKDLFGPQTTEKSNLKATICHANARGCSRKAEWEADSYCN